MAAEPTLSSPAAPAPAADGPGRLGAAFYGSCAAHWISLMLGFQAEYLIWQAHFPGDFGAPSTYPLPTLTAPPPPHH